MKRTTRIFAYASLAGFLGVATPGLAAKCSGTNINNLVSWEPSEIAKGTSLTLLRVTSVTVADDAAAPYHLVSGECIGQLLTAPDGKTMASGSCARRDKDGDVLNEEWVATDGAGNKGTWKLAGGTGKFANAKGSAQWEVTPLQGKMAAVRWSGSCQW
jgi:hypothetical protein